MGEPADYKETLALPRTAFAMRANLATTEPKLLERWREQKIWETLRDSRSGAPLFVLHDGPPYANGAPHHGHLLNKVLKDIICRDRSLAGFQVSYVPGWDCHGLPIETQVDKELGHKKREMDVSSFHDACRAYASRQMQGQQKAFERLGVQGSWSDSYRTMQPTYEAATVRALAGLVDKKLVYKGLRPVHWCTHHQTALAEAEVEYEEKTSHSAYVALKFNAESEKKLASNDVSIVVWTTTPWSLPGNVAVMVHPELTYVVVPWGVGHVVVAEARLEDFFGVCGPKDTPVPTPTQRIQGHALVGLRYQHPFLPREGQLIPSETVDVETGTGAVHTAPAHGVDDFAIGQAQGLAFTCPVDASGHFTADAGPFAGQAIDEGAKAILSHLAAHHRLLSPATLTLKHRYAHCWRCHRPVITRATEQWFLTLDEARDGKPLRARALEALEHVTWIPAWGQERIGNMLAARPDWCLSRQRLWGVPLPILYCESEGCGHAHVDGDVMRLVAEQIAEHGAAIWWSAPLKELVGDLACPKCQGTKWRKEHDILDVWFDSGVSWSAVLDARHLGHADGAQSDLYLEGSDQHRGWFHSSLLTSVGIQNRAPYKQVLTHGFVLDGKGRKISKSRGNFTDPFAQIEREGAEVWRLWAASEDYQQDVRISQEIMRRLTDTYRRIRNTLRYLLGNLDGFDWAQDQVSVSELSLLDRWAINQGTAQCGRIREGYRAYGFHGSMQWMAQLCGQDLSAFYFDILKDRLYAARQGSTERRAAQSALYILAHDLTRTLAPVLAFTCEEVWDNLPGAQHVAKSVHAATYLDAEVAELCPHDQSVVDYIKEAQTGHQARDEAVGRVREVRRIANLALEEARKNKIIGSSTEAALVFVGDEKALAPLQEYADALWADFCIVAHCRQEVGPTSSLEARVTKALGSKCARCWLVKEEVGQHAAHPTLCTRCCDVLEFNNR